MHTLSGKSDRSSRVSLFSFVCLCFNFHVFFFLVFNPFFLGGPTNRFLCACFVKCYDSIRLLLISYTLRIGTFDRVASSSNLKVNCLHNKYTCLCLSYIPNLGGQ